MAAVLPLLMTRSIRYGQSQGFIQNKSRKVAGFRARPTCFALQTSKLFSIEIKFELLKLMTFLGLIFSVTRHNLHLLLEILF